MQTGMLVTLVLPIALFIVMLGMGMSLVPEDFKRIYSVPKAFAVGLSAQMLMLPLLCFLLVTAFRVEPLLAVGLMILSFSPGGTVSNMYSFLAKGDVALSITLTAVVSLLAPFSIPLLTNFTMGHLLGDSSDFSLPVGETIAKLVVITIVPVAVGMLIRHWKPSLCDRLSGLVKVFSILFLFLIIAGIVKNNWQDMPSFIKQIGLPALTLNLLALGLGFALAMIFKLQRPQAVSISFEVGFQNGTTALLVTSTILQNDVMSISPAIYSLIMFASGAMVGLVFNFLFKPPIIPLKTPTA